MRPMLSARLPYLWYPAVFALAIVLFATMLWVRFPLMISVYLPIALAALAVVALEQFAPERADWRPRWADVRADAAYLALVQVALPRMLTSLAVIAAAGQAYDRNSSWPHHWPLAAQVLLMVLLVDLVRYWLHRACHSFGPLWRLHEVHHSPDILYTLNVGRFHPLEKALHFCADSVPLLLLGVAPEVIGGYTLLYSVNGFFQHSNVRLRYGWLNYVVGSAQTHRWHHARDPRTAYCNFGNTVIVWDLLFGTWFLPRQRALDIGIPDRAYPKEFLAQMAAPFRAAHTQRRSVRAMIADLTMAVQMRITWMLNAPRIARQLRDPMRAQRALLRRILRANRDTTYGRLYGFGAIGSYEQFRAAVPVADYEALRPFVEAGMWAHEAALTLDPAVRYLRTSGSTGKAKDIPLTAAHQRRLRRIHRVSVANQHRLFPVAFAGSILVITSPATEGRLGNGTPYGSASGAIAGSTPRLVREKFVVPPEVLSIEDSEVKYLLILRLALARRDITYLGSANASTVLALMRLYRAHERQLLGDLERGGFFLASRVPPAILTALAARLAGDPRRAAEIRTLSADGAKPRLADLWPQLRLLVTWTCASAGIAARALRSELAPRTHVHELGYVSSEFRGTFTLGRRAGSGLPTVDAHFFEFVERARWDAGRPIFLTLGQLRTGVDYYVIVTTPSGLYRYFINDLVQVSAFVRRMPLLRFVQKGKGVTNITGEKLYEAQVLEAASRTMQACGRSARFVMMLADEAQQAYRLYVEADPGPRPPAAALAQAVDAQLQLLNIEYRAKRESKRLAPLEAHWLKSGSDEAYKRDCVARGQREGQFKTTAIAYAAQFAFDIAACVDRT